MTPRSIPITLTTEERNLLYLVVAGYTPAQSARVLDRLQQRFGVTSRTALVTRAIVQCWV